jgi:tetratricopeptide (TPR) repeat protein
VDGFVGREAELAEMAQAIAGGVKPVVLWGLGGMGKTELACQFGRKYTAGQVFFARFRESFYGTVADSVALGIPGVAERPLDGAQRYCLAMEQLRLCSQKDVLIVDNADGGSRFEELKDETYRALCALPLRLVVTTRHKVNRAIEVRRLENGELYRIFENHEATVTREQMDALIAAAEGHTLTVDLMARTLAQSWGTVKPEDILRALDEGNLAQKQFPAVYSDHDPREARRQERIYARLAALFDLSAIGEAGRRVLGCATLLPEGGMEESLFYLALPEALREELDSLEKRGWLSREKGMLRIHPMVRLVCRTELKPTEENCEAFLHGIWGQYDRKQYDHEKFRQMAEVFETASNLLEDKTGFWANQAGYLWNELAETQRALACNLRSVEKTEQHQPDSNNLATGYNNVGSTYGALGDHKQELEYQLKALEIRERVLPLEHPDLATSYNNVGVTYDALGDHKQALEYQLKALGICERVLPSEHPDLATSYNNVGGSYLAMGDHEKTLEYVMKAHRIRERVLPGNHPDLAQSFNNIAWTYYALGRIGEAATHMRRAADIINRSTLPETHPHRVNFNKWADRLESEARKPKRRGWLARLFGK